MYERLGITRMLVRGGAPDGCPDAMGTANAVGREMATDSLAARSEVEPASWVMTVERGGGSWTAGRESWRCSGSASGMGAKAANQN